MNELPAPGVLATVNSPRIRRVRRRAIASPRPVPPNRRAMLSSAWTKSSKIRSCMSGAMPMPVSRTVMRSRARSS
ncbi:hypothetical protein ACVWW2_003730 [Bradyrhizobium sp. LM4.3]